jgi:hypothetical protein
MALSASIDSTSALGGCEYRHDPIGVVSLFGREVGGCDGDGRVGSCLRLRNRRELEGRIDKRAGECDLGVVGGGLTSLDRAGLYAAILNLHAEEELSTAAHMSECKQGTRRNERDGAGCRNESAEGAIVYCHVNADTLRRLFSLRVTPPIWSLDLRVQCFGGLEPISSLRST